MLRQFTGTPNHKVLTCSYRVIALRSSSSTSAATSVRLYRIILRQCKDLFSSNKTARDHRDSKRNLLLFQQPINPREHSQSNVFSPYRKSNNKYLSSWKSPEFGLLELYSKFIQAEAQKEEQQMESSFNMEDDNILPIGISISVHPAMGNKEEDEDDDELENIELLSKDDLEELARIEEKIKEIGFEKLEDKIKETDAKGTFSEPEGDLFKRNENNSLGDEGDGSHLSNSVWASQHDLMLAIRMGVKFLPPLSKVKQTKPVDIEQSSSLSSPPPLSTTSTLIDVVRCLNEQESIIQKTAVTINEEFGIRVVATSQYIGRSISGGLGFLFDRIDDGVDRKHSYRFAYRIRVENLPDDKNKSVQLLGRKWNIHERTDDNTGSRKSKTLVDSHDTGAVGKLPVLHPGDVFVYTSSCETSKNEGSEMDGLFYMAVVDSNTTKTALVGDTNVKALQENYDGEKFEMPVGPFPLQVEVED